jgi:hypothetical protein
MMLVNLAATQQQLDQVQFKLEHLHGHQSVLDLIQCQRFLQAVVYMFGEMVLTEGSGRGIQYPAQVQFSLALNLGLLFPLDLRLL